LFLLGSVLALFFGSYVPSTEAGALRSAVWFQVMLTAAYLAWLLVQRTLFQLKLAATSALTHRLLLPASAAAAALSPVWLADVWPDWFRRSVQGGLAALLVTAAVSLLSLTALGRRHPEGSAAPNPWL
jgi:hypothetical protein